MGRFRAELERVGKYLVRPSDPDVVERLAKARFLLSLGYKEFPDHPSSHEWLTLIVGLSLLPAMMLGVAV